MTTWKIYLVAGDDATADTLAERFADAHGSTAPVVRRLDPGESRPVAKATHVVEVAGEPPSFLKGSGPL